MNNQSDHINDILIRTTELDEIIGRPPHWLVRWGSAIFLGIVIMVLVLSYFLRYPESVNTPFKMVSDTPPVVFSANVDGFVKRVWVKGGAKIKKGDTVFSYKTTDDQSEIYVISPISGTIEYFGPVYTGQKIKKKEMLMAVTGQSQHMFAIVYVEYPVLKSLKKGQEVILHFADSQYGIIYGEISYISKIKALNGYYVKIALTNHLKKDNKGNVTFNDNENGSAEIIIRNERFLKKFFRNNFL